jgi:RecA-family ATPase
LLNLIEKELSENPIDALIIDAFADYYTNNMNISNDVRGFLNEFKYIANKHRCLVLFIHHTNKRSENLPPSKHNLLGSQGFEAKLRLVIELRRDSIRPSIRHLCIVKGNYLSEEYKRESFELEFDENMVFHKTGNRKLFEDIIENTNKDQGRLDRTMKIMALHEEGHSQRKIAEMVKLSPSRVNEIIKTNKDEE